MEQQHRETIQRAFGGKLREEMNGSFAGRMSKKLMCVSAVCLNAKGTFRYNAINETGALSTKYILKFLPAPLCKCEIK